MKEKDLTGKVLEAAELVRGRREVLKAGFAAGLVGGAALFAELLDPFGVRAQGKGGKGTATPPKGGRGGDVAIMNTALALEHQAIAAYNVGADSGLLSAKVKDLAIHFQSQHKAHRDLLEKAVSDAGAKPVAALEKYEFDTSKIKAEADVLAFALNLEAGAASAYLGVLKSLGSKDLIPIVAGIACDESQHAAVLRHALGLQPAPDAVVK